MTKNAFLAAYKAKLIATYSWAQYDAAKLSRFMASVAGTLINGENTWNFRGNSVTAAWHQIGGKGVPTLTALRELPMSEEFMT